MEIVEKIEQFINNLNPSYVSLATTIAMITTIVLIICSIWSLKKSEELHKKYQETRDKNRENIIRSMKGSKIKSFNYEAMSFWMQSSGFNYMTNNKINVIGYLGLRLGLMIFFMIVGFSLSILGGIIGAIIGWFAIDFVVNQSGSEELTVCPLYFSI